jgi:hypothetical protein
MSYAIGTIIYGVRIPSEGNLAKEIRASLGEDALYNNEEMGFFTCYEGTNPGWFGVRLGEIDETEDVDLRNLPQPSEETHEKYYALVEKLPEQLRMQFAIPQWMIVWESS